MTVNIHVNRTGPQSVAAVADIGLASWHGHGKDAADALLDLWAEVTNDRQFFGADVEAYKAVLAAIDRAEDDNTILSI